MSTSKKRYAVSGKPLFYMSPLAHSAYSLLLTPAKDGGIYEAR